MRLKYGHRAIASALSAVVGAAAPADVDVTWATHARPMIERCCIRCHDGLGPGAYPLGTAAEVSAKRGTVLRVLELGSMPPFLPTIESLVERPPQPTVEEITLFKAWCAAAAPVGADATPATRPPDGPVTPIAAVRLADGFEVTPEEQRTMRSFQAPLGNAEPLLVGGVRVRFDKPGLVAKLNLNLADAAVAQALDDRDSARGFRLTGDAAGSPAGALAGCGIEGEFTLPSGYAMSVPVGSALIAEAHADGRGKSEIGGFTVELLPASPGATVLIPRVVGSHSAEWEEHAGLRHDLRTAPSMEAIVVVAVILRPGVYAESCQLELSRPVAGEIDSITIIDIPRYDIHQDRPYLLREPLEVPAGSKWTLRTTHATDSTARKAIPQAVLLAASPSVAGSDASPPWRDEIAGGSIALNGPVGAWLQSARRVAIADDAFEVTPELTLGVARELIGDAAVPSTGPGILSCGLTWFDAVAAANALSSRAGLSPRYAVTDIHRDSSGSIRGAIVNRLDGTGFRLPTDEEWSAIAAAPQAATASSPATPMPGGVWEWCDTAIGAARVVRGGCWADTEGAQTADARGHIEPSTRDELFGARFVRRVR